MNFKRKNKTNRSLDKKLSAHSKYAVPRVVRQEILNNKNDRDIKEQMVLN